MLTEGTTPKTTFISPALPNPAEEGGAAIGNPVGDGAEEISRNSDAIQVGGRLFHFRNKWTFSKWAHSIVSKGLGWEWTSPPPETRLFHQKATPLLSQYVTTMLEKGTIEPCRSIRFQGFLFSRPKKDSVERRVILDLSELGPLHVL